MRSSEEVTMKKKRKMTPEELEAKRLRDEDLNRRLEEMIERYRKLNAERRAAEG
jgi:hypothetical protein